MNRLLFERKLWKENFGRIMGLDEVGRGCLCGPVAAGGVIFEPNKIPDGIKDSKKLPRAERERLAKVIKREALYWTVQTCPPLVIDEINILQASFKAMQKCADQPLARPDYLLVDGNKFTDTIYPHQCIVKGDDRSVSIAAASILAKVHRDRYMRKLHEKYPHYGWNTNVGYPTRQHFAGLKKHGITKHHRHSFRLRTQKIYD